MKHLFFIFLLTLTIACSGTKKVIEADTKPITEEKATTIETVEVVEDNDIVEEVIVVEKIIEKPIVKKDTMPIETTIKDTKIETTLIAKDAFNHDSWHNLLQKYVSNTGNVNYKALKSNRKTLLAYITQLSKNMPNDNWTKEDKLAYWINAYNAMTVDLILRHYPIKSIKDIDKPWEQRFWKLGDKWYNLDEIEHQILRKMNEPRIHFAIVCASYSCPKLENHAYVASNIENQLTKATKSFLSDPERNSISENKIVLSKIFQWFAKDFKQNGSLIDFINQYLDIQVSAKAKKTFKVYSWVLNE